jgi:hypothetical protein
MKWLQELVYTASWCACAFVYKVSWCACAFVYKVSWCVCAFVYKVSWCACAFVYKVSWCVCACVHMQDEELIEWKLIFHQNILYYIIFYSFFVIFDQISTMKCINRKIMLYSLTNVIGRPVTGRRTHVQVVTSFQIEHIVLSPVKYLCIFLACNKVVK